MSEKSEIKSEAARLVREWAGPREDGDNIKSMIGRAARRLKLTYSRAKAIYYREARVIAAEEMDRLRGRKPEQPEKTADEVFSELTALVVRAQRILQNPHSNRRGDRSGRVGGRVPDSSVAAGKPD